MISVDWKDKIVIDQEILVGKPVIKGTRISLELILGLLAEGWSNQKILENYPQLEKADIEAVLKYAAETLRDEKVYPIS